MTIECMTLSRSPIYHSSNMGRSPFDEPSVLASVLNEVFVPLLQKQFPEIVDSTCRPPPAPFAWAA